MSASCLQEICNGSQEAKKKTAAGRSLERMEVNLLQKIKDTLTEHTAIYTPQYVPYFGIALLIRKTIPILATGEVCVYREPGYISPIDIADHCRTLQYVTLEATSGPITILNVHAAWQPVGKIDTPERLEQTRRIIDFAKTFTHPLVLAGDFNLLPDTQSIRIFEKMGWENLIRTHHVASTRTSHYDKPERFADYMFIKNGVQVHDFRVLPEEVSDHAGLFLEC